MGAGRRLLLGCIGQDRVRLDQSAAYAAKSRTALVGYDPDPSTAHRLVSPSYRIAAIAGDGIGTEVLPEGIRVVDAVARRHGITITWEHKPWASCAWYAEHGAMMPDDWHAQLSPLDAIFFGAVGWPATVPDHISLWGSLLKFRREFDQYVNLRPCRLMPGVPSPLAGRAPGDIDFYVVRENTEGEYSNVG